MLQFDETYQLFPCKKAYFVKRQDFIQNIFLKTVLLMNDLDKEPEPEP